MTLYHGVKYVCHKVTTQWDWCRGLFRTIDCISMTMLWYENTFRISDISIFSLLLARTCCVTGRRVAGDLRRHDIHMWRHDNAKWKMRLSTKSRGKKWHLGIDYQTFPIALTIDRRRIGAKPLLEPIMTYCHLKQTSEKIQSKYTNFLWKNAFENVVSEMAAILSGPQYVTSTIFDARHQWWEARVKMFECWKNIDNIKSM